MIIREHYDIRISDAQRLMLIRGVQLAIEYDQQRKGLNVNVEELMMLKGMLEDVTDHMRESDTLHDFTL